MSFYDEASWVLIPEGIKEDVVYAQKPTDGLGDLTFTRASDATRTNSAGVIERTPWNLVTFSEQFDNAYWVKDNATISANNTSSPSGNLDADKLVENTANATHNVYNTSISVSTNIDYTYSFYAKNAGRNFVYCQLFYFGSNTGFNVVANLTDGTFTTFSTGVTTGLNPSASVTELSNGWFRITVGLKTSATSTSVRATHQVRLDASTGTYTGNGVDGIYIWGAQLVEGTDAKPYFATTNRQDVPRLDYRNADGSLNSCPRLLLEPQRTNSIRNSTMVGAVAGSPGTLPTNWSVIGGAGLTQTIVGTGTESGLTYLDVRYNGTATSTDVIRLTQETNTGIAASNGQTWSLSPYVKVTITSGATPSYSLRMAERTVIGSLITVGTQSATFTSTLTRQTYTRTLTGGVTVGAVVPEIGITVTNGATYDFTIRIAAPQMELGAYATTFIPTTTAAVTRLADVFSRNNLFTNNIVTSSGGTWFLDLSSILALVRDGATSFFLGDSASGTVGNSINIRNNSTSAQRLTINKVVSTSLTQLYLTLTDNVKMAIKWNGTTADVFVNGSKVVTATAFTATELQFLGGTGSDVPKFINQSSLFPVPLTDDQCIEITTL
jgi:hypothetical protein